MGSSKRPPALASTGRAVLAASVALALALTRVFASQDIFFDVAVLAVVVAALVGLYALRRRARKVLVYERGAATSSSGSAGAGPHEHARCAPPSEG
jgi:hypothetical protein